MLRQPPRSERRQDGWWIVVRNLGAIYEFGPFPRRDSPACRMTTYELPRAPKHRSWFSRLLRPGL